MAGLISAIASAFVLTDFYNFEYCGIFKVSKIKCIYPLFNFVWEKSEILGKFARQYPNTNTTQLREALHMYGFQSDQGRTKIQQAGFQLAGTLITVAFSIISGLLSGNSN